VGAVDIVDQMRELIVRDCLLVMFENIPSRLVPENADVISGRQACCADQCK
jgi:hypothetical protein